MPKSKNLNKPAVSIVKPVYAMASVDGHSAEITLYGDIYESQPTDWYGRPIEGQFVLLSEFLEDLKAIEGCQNIIVRMNSYGGDAGVSNVIHNRLRELSRKGVSTVCVVDGVAMSGGSLIMCSCDTVQVNPSSLIMIHKCWAFLFGGYNADEMRQMADENDTWDRMQIEIYKRKTGLPDDEILGMMKETTYMTGREAVEKGFADELIEDAEPVDIAASADGRALFVRGRQMHLAPGMFAPDTIPTVDPEASATVETDKKQPEVTGSDEGGNSMTTEELRAQYPEQVAEVEAAAVAAAADNTDAINAAVQAERERIAGIDAIASLFDDDTVNAAKYGEHACSAQEMAYRAAQSAQAQGRNFLNAMQADNQASGANDVNAAVAPQEEPETMSDADMMAAGEAMAKKLAGIEK